jgi:hypothetical protein
MSRQVARIGFAAAATEFFEKKIRHPALGGPTFSDAVSRARRRSSYAKS